MTVRNLFVVLLFVWVLPLKAQQSQYNFARINVNEGLSGSRAKCFLKDKDGFVWIGTSSGLNRFDGYAIQKFVNNPRDTTSLISNDINKLFEDPNGKIWVDTWSGQCIYDPETEQFDRDANNALKNFGIPPGSLTTIVKGSKGTYWFIHATEGLFQYTPSTKKLKRSKHIQGDSTTLFSDQISSLKEDRQGNLWIIHRNGIIEKMDGNTHKIIYRNYVINKKYFGEILEYSLMLDSDGDLWISVSDNNNIGVYYFDLSTKRLLHIHKNSPQISINSDIVRGVVQDAKGIIWVGTDHGGLNLINKRNLTVQYILHNPEDDKSLSQNSVNALYKDYDGFIWVGTFKEGVNYYHENAVRFKLYQHQTKNPSTLPYNDVNCFVEDEKGNLWIGTNGEGLIYYDRNNDTFTQRKNIPNNSNSLSSNVIVSMCFDRSNMLWVGTYYGGLNLFDGKKFTRYKHNLSDPSSLADDNIWEITEDSQKRLWLGTLESGVDLFNRKEKKFIHYPNGGPNSVHSSYVPTIVEDNDGNMWFGTGYGVDVLDRLGHIKSYTFNANNKNSLSNNNVTSVLCDSYGLLWIGTTDGLNLYNKKTATFTVFRQEDGLPHSSILTILEDDTGNIWLSTPNGISNLILARDKNKEISFVEFRNFDEADGLQGKLFNEGAAYKTRKGELIFGGPKGFNIFRPRDVVRNNTKPKIILSDFQIFNKTVKIGEAINGNVILDKSITYTKEITLEHINNVFSIEFAALTFFHPEKSQYKYKLVGFNKDWLITDAKSRKVTYTNLDPGTYTFTVMASNSDGVWNNDGLRLKIVILPPFWKSKTAFFMYIFLFFGALVLSRQMILSRERLKNRIEKERNDANRLHELDMMKIKFFTNVSHEFRTPLSLILAPLERLLKQTTDPVQKNQFQMIYRNARRLLNLVNQLLDLRRMEVQGVSVNLSEGDIVKFIRDTSASFSDLSEKKSIEFSIHCNAESIQTTFDKDKLEKILFNLLSNAFKFTPEHGKVAVEVSQVEKPNETLKWVEIKVSDTGIGIPVEKQDKIFERFFQNDLPKSMVNQGSGIGLSITSEFVRALNGSISVQSEPEKGSCFTVLLPIQRIVTDVKDAPKADEVDVVADHDDLSTDAAQESKLKLPTLLLVEDNEDFRFYLKDNLKSQYHILEARNGKEGYEKTIAHLPDLVVSDVMMPEMNGLELCLKIKGEKNISHTPVILLTARTAEEQKLEGFETGADDYIVKPFNFEILQSRIKNLIQQRETFHKNFRKQVEVKASDINITSLDEKLIQNAIKLVEDNIANPEFSVEHLSRELGMSRVHLYKKLLTITGKAPLEFIRVIRIQRAAQLLEKSQLTVAEVAYKVGFNNPKYFTKYFKEEFNMLPSAYAAASKKKKNIS